MIFAVIGTTQQGLVQLHSFVVDISFRHNINVFPLGAVDPEMEGLCLSLIQSMHAHDTAEVDCRDHKEGEVPSDRAGLPLDHVYIRDVLNL